MSEKTNQEVAEFFNSVTDALGNHALHICALYGSCTSMICVDRLYPRKLANKFILADEVMDALFDIQYFECDPLTRMDKDTPLHIAVRYANDKNPELGEEMISMMCEAGCDPRVRNKHGQKPADLVFNKPEIKQVLQKAEYILAEGIQDETMGSDNDVASDSD